MMEKWMNNTGSPYIRYHSYFLISGLAHGLILLPVLLSLMGPKGQLVVAHTVAQQTSSDGKNQRTFLEI